MKILTVDLLLTGAFAVLMWPLAPSLTNHLVHTGLLFIYGLIYVVACGNCTTAELRQRMESPTSRFGRVLKKYQLLFFMAFFFINLRLSNWVQ